MLKKLTSVLLVLSLTVSLLSALPAVSAAESATYKGVSYSTDYTKWKQTDAAWKSISLGTSSTTMGASGCLVTAIAIEMCRSAGYSATQFNPGVLVTWLNQKGYFDGSGGLSYAKMTTTTCPRYVYAGRFDAGVDQYTDISVLCTKIQSLQASGYSVIARVNSTTGRSNHFVAVERALGSKDARIYDAVNGRSLLSDYSQYYGLVYFKTNPSGNDTILNTASGSTNSNTSTSTTTNTNTNTSTSTTTNTNTNTNTGTTTNSTTTTTKTGTTTTISTSTPTVTNAASTMVTITYDNNWVYAGKTTHTLRSGENYSLPTLYRDDAAFLGWYRDGEMVTNSSIIPAENHTLVAHWDTKGFCFSVGDPYDSRFTDVPVNKWYYDSVASIFSYGLMNGTTNTTFAPTSELPFQQAITIAARVCKQYTDGDMLFPDQSSPWYLTYVRYGLEEGIIDAMPLDFSYIVTRQEFAEMLSNALPYAALPQVNTIASGSIPDVYKNDDAVYRLYRAGIFQGDGGNNSFRPNDSITRAEAAAVLTRIVNPNARLLFTLS